ncbi:MAG TPA: protease inhibitor I42 family protein [Pseudoduganella sp.]|jgi:predicted secreted protein
MTRLRPQIAVTADQHGQASVALPESPATGYRWELEDPALSRHVAGAAFAETGSRAPGSAGTRVFSLDLHGLAGVELVFVLKRSWEASSVERQGVTVTLPAP